MKVNKKEYKVIQSAMQQWERKDLIKSELSQALLNDLQIKEFDFQKLAKLSFLSAFICLVISICAILADEIILRMIEIIFQSSYLKKFFALSMLSILTFLWGALRSKKHPEKRLSNEFIYLLALFFNAGAITLFNEVIRPYFGDLSKDLILFCVFEFAIIAFLTHSTKIWVISLLVLASWLDCTSFYGAHTYYIVMRELTKFVCLGLVLCFISELMRKDDRFSSFAQTTLVMGLLYLFVALWILSLTDSFFDQDKNVQGIIWSIVFAVTAIASCVQGLKFENSTTWKFGVTFLMINLYTKFFEYCWSSLHKGVFFAILALSFWLVGKWSEKLFTKPNL